MQNDSTLIEIPMIKAYAVNKYHDLLVGFGGKLNALPDGDPRKKKYLQALQVSAWAKSLTAVFLVQQKAPANQWMSDELKLLMTEQHVEWLCAWEWDISEKIREINENPGHPARGNLDITVAAYLVVNEIFNLLWQKSGLESS